PAPHLLKNFPLTPSSAGEVATCTVGNAPFSTGTLMKEKKLKGNGTFMFVLTKPGSTAFAVTPVPSSRRASSYVNIRLSSLVWLYAPISLSVREQQLGPRVAAALPHVGNRGLASLSVPADHHHRDTRPRQLERDLPAHPSAGSRDDRDLAVHGASFKLMTDRLYLWEPLASSRLAPGTRLATA